MIESTEDMNEKTKKFKCKCDKSGKQYERIKIKDFDQDVKLSNTEAAFSDEEIVKFIQFLKDNGHGGDCWCKYITEYVEEVPNASL